jgi:hypothetical protein
MHALIKGLAVGVLGAIASLGALSANAQSDGSDYHPLQMNSAARPEVDADAIAASHATGTEAIGQSTAAPMVNSQGVSREAVYREAVAASHGTTTEAIGQSTGMAGITGGVPH